MTFNLDSTWTQFWDMHSGGMQKEEWSKIYIEAPEDEASLIFYNRFGHNPNRVTCTCCGEDYSISEGSIAELTAYHRNCSWSHEAQSYVEAPQVGEEKLYNNGRAYRTLEEYAQDSDVLFIPADEIDDSERRGELPEQGYVWVD